MLEIKILGTYITKCRVFEQRVQEVLEKEKIEANVSLIDDVNEMTKYGIMVNTSMIINENIEIKGRVPKKEEIKRILIKYVK